MNLFKKSITIFVVAISCASFGQEQKKDSIVKVNPIEEVIITATSTKNKNLLNQPESISILKETELKRGNGLFLDDAINTNVTGVFMERRTTSAGQQFNIRGYGNGVRGTNGANSNFDTQGSKVYLNNIPVTDAEGITLMDDLDFSSIGNVEILKGPAGTLYGLAIAGVVNLKTVKPEAGKTSLSHNTLFGSYGLKRTTTQLQIGGTNGSLLVNYGNQSFDGFMDHTESKKDFLNLVAETKISEKQKINAYLGYSNSYDQRNGELTVNQYNNFDYSGNPAYIKNDAHSNVISFRGGVNNEYQISKNVSNSTSFFGTGLSSNVSSAGGWTDKSALNYGLRSAFNLNFDLSETFKLSSISGIELQQQNAQTIAYAMVVNPADPAGYNILGTLRSNQNTISKTNSIFTEWTLAMPYNFSVTAGVGSSYMGIDLSDRTNSKKYQNSYNDMISPKFAINKVFNNNISVYASYSKGYKAPVSSYFFIPFTGEVNNNLKAEMANQFEIGTKGNLLNNKLNYEIAVFQTNYKDKMTAIAVPNAGNTATLYSYVTNGGEQEHKGVEVSLKYSAYQSENAILKSFTPFVNMTYADYTYKNFVFQRTYNRSFDFSGEKVAGTPPVVFNSGFDFTIKHGFYGNVTYSYRDAMFYSYVPESAAATEKVYNETNSFNLLNAKIGFQKTIINHLTLDASMGVNNITNSQYYQMVFVNQLPDAFLPAPINATFFGGLNIKYTF